MPCDTVSTAKVKLNAASIDSKLLQAAMATLGVGQYDYNLNSNGEITVRNQRSSTEFTAKVNQAYSKQVVTSQAKRFGWQVKEQPDGKLLVMKASF